MDDLTQQALAALRDTIAQNDRRYTEQSTNAAEALRVALDAANKRLDQMNEFRGMITDQAGRMLTRVESTAAREAIHEKIEQLRTLMDGRFGAEIKPINDRLDLFNQPNWPLMASCMSIFLVIVAGVWLVIGLRIDATVTPVSLAANQLNAAAAANEHRVGALEATAAASTQSDTQSRADRGQLNDRLHILEGLVAANAGTQHSEYAVINAKLIEIETQFCGSDIVRNLLHAFDMRVIAMMWAKLNPGEKYPTDNAFYPKICNRPSATAVSSNE